MGGPGGGGGGGQVGEGYMKVSHLQNIFRESTGGGGGQDGRMDVKEELKFL